MWSIPVGTACTLRKKVYSLLSGLTVGYRQDLFYWLHYLSLPNFNSLLVHVLCYDWEKCMNISLQSVCLCYFIFSSCFCFSLMKILCSVQFSSVAQSCPTLCNPMNHSTPGLPVHHQLPESLHSESCPSSRWCHPAISSSIIPFSSCPQSLPASVFSNESTLHTRWPKYWSFSFSIIPSKDIPLA